MAPRLEVYLQFFNNETFSPSNVAEFNRIKQKYPNINLATTDQIKASLEAGSMVCEAGLANLRDPVKSTDSLVIATSAPGNQASNRPSNLNCVPSEKTGHSWRTKGVYLLENPPLGGGSTSYMWLYGVKPAKGTPGVFDFKSGKWSQFDPEPPSR